MKFISKYWVLFFISATFWCVLNESFNYLTLVLSIPVSIFTIVLIHLLFSGNYYTKIYRFPILSFIKYFIILLFNIYKSAFETVYYIFTDKINPTFINIHTDIKNEWYRSLIANSITLTPGTVSVAMDNDELTVLWIYPTSLSKENAGNIIKGSYENILLKEDSKC